MAFFCRLAEIAGEYLKKGSSCYSEGRIRTRKGQDKDGKDTYSTEIVAEQMQMLGGRSGGGEGGGGGGGSYSREASGGGSGGGGYGGGRAAGGQGGGERAAPARRQQPAPSNGFEDMDDDIPF